MEDFYDFMRSLWVVWLMILFAGIVAWVVWPSNKKRLEKYGEIPFKDEPDRHGRKRERTGQRDGENKGT
jgi:cytochrome c oxidase cbb3-type subunit 4